MELQRGALGPGSRADGDQRKALRRRIASGQLPVFPSGRHILRVRPEDVDAMLRPFWLG
ncbi:MAG: DNA-binding protein [Nigerium sp.]|nr:DNA-binding protein [Nigerium sp.]